LLSLVFVQQQLENWVVIDFQYFAKLAAAKVMRLFRVFVEKNQHVVKNGWLTFDPFSKKG
jgi:hypothetical protein